MVASFPGAGPPPLPFDRPCRVAAFVVPWSIAVLLSSGNARFADDVSLVRSVGLLPVGLEGLVSSAVGGVFALLPIGNHIIRLSFAAALGLGLASWLVYRIATRLLSKDPELPGLAAPLGLVAALSATLGPAFAMAGSSPGGAATAVALSLSALAVSTRVVDLGPRAPWVLGTLIAVTALESRTAALAVLLAHLAHSAARLERPSAGDAGRLLAGACSVLILPLGLTVGLVLSDAPHSELSFGLLGHQWALSLSPLDHSAAVETFWAAAGPFWCVLSLVGLGHGLFSSRFRSAVIPLLALLLCDLLLEARGIRPTERDPLAAVRLLAIAALSITGALGARSAVSLLNRVRIPFARSAGVLLVVYAVTLVLVSLEDSASAAEAREASATEVWTDETLQSLPATSALLVRSEAPFFRLLAARVTQGARPDLLVIPSALLEERGVRTELLARERGLVPLVREILLRGRPSEYALAALADARPTHVELDPTWDRRLFSYLTPRPFFTELSAHPLGRSDREMGIEQGEDVLMRVIKAVEQSPDRDPATRALLSGALSQRALLLAALGDRLAAEAVIESLLALDPDAPLGHELKTRLARPGRGSVDVSGLLAAL